MMMMIIIMIIIIIRYFNMNLQLRTKYYKHIAESVINVNSATIMWDVPVITGRIIVAN
jgi:hypothetical protein